MYENPKFNGGRFLISSLKIIAENLPYAGPFFKFIFSYIGDNRDARTKEFLKKIDEELLDIKFKIYDVSEEHKPIISLAMEKVIGNVQSEIIEEKRLAYVKYVRSLLLSSQNEGLSTNKTELFLTTLENLTLLEIQILKFIYKFGESDINNIEIQGVDRFLVSGACSRLKDKGLIYGSGGHTFIEYGEGVGHTIGGNVSISGFGNQFIEYCLN